MSTLDKIYTISSLVLTHGSHLALLGISGFLFFRTKRAGFLFIALGFSLFLIRALTLWFLTPHFIESVEHLTFLMRSASFLYSFSLILILVGFYKLFISKASRYEQCLQIMPQRSI